MSMWLFSFPVLLWCTCFCLCLLACFALASYLVFESQFYCSPWFTIVLIFGLCSNLSSSCWQRRKGKVLQSHTYVYYFLTGIIDRNVTTAAPSLLFHHFFVFLGCESQFILCCREWWCLSKITHSHIFRTRHNEHVCIKSGKVFSYQNFIIHNCINLNLEPRPKPDIFGGRSYNEHVLFSSN